MSRIIAISNQKGGVGKTTTAINLAAYLAQAGRSVLLLDFDPQGNATSGSGINVHQLERNIYHALFEPNLLESTLIDTEHGYALLPAHPVLAAAELELGQMSEREYALRRLLDILAHDYIIIDCPPSLGMLTINALSAADSLIIPVQTEYYALEGLGQLLDTVSRIQQGINPQLSILGVLLTMYSIRTSLSQQVEIEVRQHFKNRVFNTIVPRNVRLAEAPSYGLPIAKHDRWSKGARSYKQLAKEIEQRLSQS